MTHTRDGDDDEDVTPQDTNTLPDDIGEKIGEGGDPLTDDDMM